MEIKGYDESGEVAWIDRLLDVRANPEGTYDLHLTEHRVTRTEESLDRHYPGWREFLLTEFSPSWEELSQAIRDSQNETGPAVYGEIGGQIFELRGVLSGKDVCVPAASRDVLREATTPERAAMLKPWDHFDRDMYSGFYVPADWFDGFLRNG